MAVYNVRIICFLVLMAWNSGQAFVLKSVEAPSFRSGSIFPPKHNGPNLKAADQSVNALEKKIESKSPYLEATDKRLNNLEKKIENKFPFLEATDRRVDDIGKIIANLSSDNAGNEVRLGDMETAMTNLSRDNERKEVRLGDLETAIKNKSPYEEATDKRVDNLEKKIANLKSTLDKDCGSPPPLKGTYVVYNSSKVFATAVYRCKKGLMQVNPDEKGQSACQESELWKPVNIKCANISGCSKLSGRKVLYSGTWSETTSGFTCQRWDTQLPHAHSFKDDHYFTTPGLPETVSGSANYCRDPSSNGYLWCYTTDPITRWEKCSVPVC